MLFFFVMLKQLSVLGVNLHSKNTPVKFGLGNGHKISARGGGWREITIFLNKFGDPCKDVDTNFKAHLVLPNLFLDPKM